MKGPWLKPWTSRSWQFQENGGQMSPIGGTASTAWPQGTEGLLKQVKYNQTYFSSTTRPYLIHNSTVSHLQLDRVSSTTRPYLTHNWTVSHPQLDRISSTTRPWLIHNSTVSHPQLDRISSTTRPCLIHNSTVSHPQLDRVSSTTRPCLIHCSTGRSSRVSWAGDCQFKRCNSPGFDANNLRLSKSIRAADAAVLKLS